MTPDEADVMLEFTRVGNPSRFGGTASWCRWDRVFKRAQQLLNQHADDQKPTDLAWLVENVEGSKYERDGHPTWEFVFQQKHFTVVVRCDPPVTTICELDRDGEILITIPVATRGDVRRLPDGLLVMKQKEGV